MLILALLLSAVLLLSWGLTGGLRRYALQRNVLDMPNQRSSHSVPTPRGGGMAIVMSFLLALLVALALGWLALGPAMALLGAGSLVAVIGFLDDHGHVPARWRLFVHFTAAIWGLCWLGGMPPMKLGDTNIELGWLGGIFGAVYLVWLLNLYNFMDGIDGIAGVEAVTCCLSVVLICILLGNWQAALLPAALGLAAMGFLIWNFPPARIFMGDAGSGFLGLILGLISLYMTWLEPQLFLVWLILLGVFLVDASITLLRRFVRGEKVYQAHRSHAYQHASRQYGKHLPVTLAVVAINLCWLTPLAVWVALDGNAWLALPLAYVPLVCLALRYRAGLAE
ncbi:MULTISPECIES: glycosyltransferase family 4 protein [unclassified Pseudomonas]|uniref:MraY family glycosyltransferase n=1 Tax=unclassified Pseudomonas TaxID=196821 RepID=UPI0024489190|nr:MULTISPECIES: glycosyltransferase family 4 protein [unclassified Pseudomonas]MDG9925356.1 glycosyltransferase family 4 protein [Pseudomonas sp. GD04045]MDH0037304.1 glycosyltransferase family 4 protein [Pseudomonas sp. GD04019]